MSLTRLLREDMIETADDLLALPAKERAALFERIQAWPEHINEHLRWLQDKITYSLGFPLDMGQRRRTQCFHASSLSYYRDCQRVAYYQYNGARGDSPSTKSQRIFHTGHAVHAQLQAYFQSIADRTIGALDTKQVLPPLAIIELEMEASFWDPDLELSGHADLLGYLQDPIQGEVRFVGEIKSMKHNSFLKAQKAQKPFDYHLDQATAYCKEFEAPMAIYIYFDKDESDILVFPVLFNQKRWDELVKILVESRERTSVPDFRPVSFKCKDCDFNRICKPGRYTRRGRRT